MPTYDYACTHCDHSFETVQAFTDDALTECPQCGGRLRKVFGSVGVVFKGSGFYRTDSRSGTGSSGKASTTSSTSSSSSTSGSSSGSDAASSKSTSSASGSGSTGGSGSGGSGGSGSTSAA